MSESEGLMLVRRQGQPWQSPESVGYVGEADLQQMLAAQPTLIPGVGPHALAAREFHTGVGPSDVLVVDSDGTLTVVECKLASNAEIRRKIIGQVLDYAARLWRMPLADFEGRWRACSGGTGVLGALEEEAAAALEQALADGAFRLVLAVDRINEDLRRIVEYLNAHTNEQVTVLALELHRVSHGGVDILTPRTFGEELVRAKTEKAKRDEQENWTVEDVLARLDEFTPSLRPTLQRLIDALTDLGCTAQGTKAAQPSMIFRLESPDGQVSWPYAIYTGSTPNVQVNFHWLSAQRKQSREDFLIALASPPAAIDADAIRTSGYKKRPPVPLAALTSDHAHQQMVAAAAALAV